MTDKTDSKEREALVAYLKDCDAHDIVPDVGGAWHAAFQAGRASLAASAGSEPVASIYITPAGEREMDDWKVKLPPGRNILYTHPSPPEGAGWINLPGTPPEPGTPVLLDIGKKYPIRAMWAAKHTVEAHDEASPEWVDYDDVTDAVYCPEGWYEWNENEEVHWAVNAKPRAWMAMPLPAPPASEAKEA